MDTAGEPAPKIRLLRAAASLLAESGGSPVSTRQVTRLAAVTAPTLYHHFGDKEGLFDAVVAEGFTEYLEGERNLPSSGQPVEDLRRHWDNHVQFGLDHPHLYLVMFGNIRPERRPSMVAEAEAFLEEVLKRAAAAARLVVPPAEAARSLLAANIGVTLMLIAEPASNRSLELSVMTRGGCYLRHRDRFRLGPGHRHRGHPFGGGRGHCAECRAAGIAPRPALQLRAEALPRVAPSDIHPDGLTSNQFIHSPH
jgi:AcrR family transcriptional regulator